jgi:hypothetical protein
MNQFGRRANLEIWSAFLPDALQNPAGPRFRESFDGRTKAASEPGQFTQGV